MESAYTRNKRQTLQRVNLRMEVARHHNWNQEKEYCFIINMGSILCYQVVYKNVFWSFNHGHGKKEHYCHKSTRRLDQGTNLERRLWQ